MHNILITGGNGQLGRAIMAMPRDAHSNYHAPSHDTLDVCNRDSVERYIAEHNIDIVINCAAYTDVERAESEPKQAMQINGEAVGILAKACSRHNATLIHISTDYVFGGNTHRNTPYCIDDTTDPINSYGRSKTEGEREALRYDRAIVIRTSWLYAPWGKNFCRTILRVGAEQSTLHVVNDQRGTPTSALSLARFIVHIIEQGDIDTMSGIYHFTDEGECTWYDFAKEIVRLAELQCNVVACSSEERKTQALRPRYSVLDKSHTHAIYPTAIKPWQETLAECIEMIKRQH